MPKFEWTKDTITGDLVLHRDGSKATSLPFDILFDLMKDPAKLEELKGQAEIASDPPASLSDFTSVYRTPSGVAEVRALYPDFGIPEDATSVQVSVKDGTYYVRYERPKKAKG